MSSRPNFLFIITDQQRADHLGCYGNTTLRTPHIDSLSRVDIVIKDGGLWYSERAAAGPVTEIGHAF